MTLGDQEPQLGIQHNRKQINSSNFVGVLNQGLATLGGRLGRNISQDGWVQYRIIFNHGQSLRLSLDS